jgi:AraC-like DNA-binding protein
MGNFTTLHYHDFKEQPKEIISGYNNSVENKRHLSEDPFWGKFEEERVSIPHVEIIRIKTDFKDNFRVLFADNLFDVVNICLSLKGTTRVVNQDVNFDVSLHHSKIHGCYVPAPEYEVYVDKITDNVHFAIDLKYFLELLSHSEAWADSLRKKIEGKQTVSPGPINVSSTMQRIVSDILNCPLDGCLKKLIIEGKVLELIALNLGYFVADTKTRALNVNKRDHDTFHAIRNHLDRTFMDDHSLKSIGKSFGVNEFKLKSGFREMYGTTIFDYIHDRKMEHARELLLDSGYYVNEVSRKVGYKNPNHFSTAFKKKFGVSPARLR